MLRSEAVTIIKRGLGFRQTQESSITAALQQAQRELETGKTLPDWLLTYDEAITVTANNPEITLPNRFLRFHDGYQFYYINSNSARVFLPRKQYTEAYTAYVASGEEDDSAVIDTAGQYGQVLVQKNKTSALIIPTPTVSYTAYLTFYQGALPLTSDIENAWLLNAPDYLIGLAGGIVAGNLRDKDAISVFGAQAQRGKNAFIGDVVETELAGRPLVMGRNN